MARIRTAKDVSRKEVILKAAATLFREKGYKAASMRDLAERVGVEAASLYNHIRSKTELLHDICFDVANIFWEHMNQVEVSDKRPIEKLETLLRFHIRQMIENFQEVYVSDMEQRSEDGLRPNARLDRQFRELANPPIDGADPVDVLAVKLVDKESRDRVQTNRDRRNHFVAIRC